MLVIGTMDSEKDNLITDFDEAKERDVTYIDIQKDDISIESPVIDLKIQPQPELLKTVFSAVYFLLGVAACLFSLLIVHERVPNEVEPLPDVVFEYLPYVHNTHDITEFCMAILIVSSISMIVLHKYRFVLIRRTFFLYGTLYLYRSITIYVTTLPVSEIGLVCAPKSKYEPALIMERFFGHIFGGENTHMCGSYMFSGHTIVIMIACLTINEYSPRSWKFLHWFYWLISYIALAVILLSHRHYTIDVVIAYLIVTRLFWSYHLLCNVKVLKKPSDFNTFSYYWWFPIFRYLESNVRSDGGLPCEYDWPFPMPSCIVSRLKYKKTKLYNKCSTIKVC